MICSCTKRTPHTHSATTYAPVLRAVQMALNELRANVKSTTDRNTSSILYVWNGMAR